MIGFVRQKISVADAFFLLLLIVPDPQMKLTTTAGKYTSQFSFPMETFRLQP